MQTCGMAIIDQNIALQTVRIELLRAGGKSIAGQLRITPLTGGKPVLVDAKRLDQWAAKLYRAGVLA